MTTTSSLQLIGTTHGLDAYYSARCECLLLEWHGRLLLSDVQAASVELLNLPLPTCRQLLVDTQYVGNIGYGVPQWVARKLLPGLRPAGIERLAWVHGRVPGTLHISQQLVSQALGFVPAGLFADLEHAEAWLRAALPTAAQPAGYEAQRYLVRARDVLAWSVLKDLARSSLDSLGID